MEDGPLSSRGRQILRWGTGAGRYQMSLPQRRGGVLLPDSVLQREKCDTESLRTSLWGSCEKEILPIYPVSLLLPQQLQQRPPEKVERKELPPEHRSLKISFDKLLRRCSLSAADLVSLSLPHDVLLTPLASPRISELFVSSLCDSFLMDPGPRYLCLVLI